MNPDINTLLKGDYNDLRSYLPHKSQSTPKQSLEEIEQKILSRDLEEADPAILAKIKKRLIKIGLDEHDPVLKKIAAIEKFDRSKELPMELHGKIAKKVDLKITHILSMANKSYRQIYTTPEITAVHLEKPIDSIWTNTEEAKKRLLKLAQHAGTHLTKIHLQNLPFTGKELEDLCQSCPNLKKIEGMDFLNAKFIDSLPFPPEGSPLIMTSLVSYILNADHIDIRRFTTSLGYILEKYGTHFTELNLERLPLDKESFSVLLKFCPNLEKLQVPNYFENILEELSKFPKLTDLKLIDSKKVPNNKLISSDVQLEKLKSLELSNWTFTDPPPSFFVNAVPNLISLTFSDCKLLSPKEMEPWFKAFTEMNHLKAIHFQGMPAIKPPSELSHVRISFDDGNDPI